MMISEVIALNVAKNHISSECFGFEFKVEKFSSVTNVVTSQLVSSHSCESRWRVLLETVHGINVNYFDVTRRTVGNKMRVGLERTDLNKCKVQVSFFFDVLNSQGQIYFKESITKVFSLAQNKFYCDYIKRPGRIAQRNGIRLVEFSLPDDKLTIRGNVFMKECCSEKVGENLVNTMDNIAELQCNFKYLYQNNLFSDVVLNFNNDKIYAHKVVLASRSPVFKKMFEHDTSESKLKVVNITDIEKKVFDAFLVFLYTGVVKNEGFDIILPLYAAADKYEVKTLFKTCSSLLVTKIAHKTAPAILKYADLHRDEQLKEKAFQHICENFLVVEKTNGWESLLDSDPRLASWILKTVSSNIAAKVKKISAKYKSHVK